MYKQKVKFVMEYPNSMLYAFFPSVPLVLFVCLSDQATMNVEDFKCTIRQIRQQEFGELPDFLYEALFFPDGEPKADRSLIKKPELFRYISNFGRPGDLAFVAEHQDGLVGAIWVRVFPENQPGYGYADAESPELSVAVRQPYRHLCVGELLWQALLQQLRENGVQQVSLSVDKRNFAFQWYKRLGFTVVRKTIHSCVMVRKI